MNYKTLLQGLFFALIVGITLVYTLGGAAIASASISGHTEVIPGAINIMVSLGMTWLMLTGIPLLVLICYHVYESLHTFLSDMSNAIASAIHKQKIPPIPESFDRLELYKEETHVAVDAHKLELEETKR